MLQRSAFLSASPTCTVEELTPKPTLVAIDELQLHDLHIAEAAVPPIMSVVSYSFPFVHIGGLPMKTVHPVQSVLPSDPRPPARTGIDNSAPMIDVAVTKVTESREWR